MELADHGSLDARIEKLRLLQELDMLDIGVKIASALDMALKYDLLHRDIKPGNILFNADHEPKLIDFGLARKADQEHEVEDVTWGTPYYVAPEKIKREPETFLSDMYSLGATLYHAMTGHVPFEAPTVEEVIIAQVQTPLTPPNLVVPEITQPTSDALVKAMAKNPAERFLSYELFIMALEAARSQLLVMQNQAAAGAKVQEPYQLVETGIKQRGAADFAGRTRGNFTTNQADGQRDQFRLRPERLGHGAQMFGEQFHGNFFFVNRSVQQRKPGQRQAPRRAAPAEWLWSSGRPDPPPSSGPAFHRYAV